MVSRLVKLCLVKHSLAPEFSFANLVKVLRQCACQCKMYLFWLFGNNSKQTWKAIYGWRPMWQGRRSLHFYELRPHGMMTSSNGNIFRVTGHLCGEFPHKDQWRGALMFSLICVWINDWVNNREAGDLRPYRANYDVIVNGLIESMWHHWYD